LNQLQIPFFLYNRTPEKAQKLAQQFGGTAITDLAAITTTIQVVISTVPSSAEFEVPQNLVHKELLVVELSYFPRFTKMLKQAQEQGFKYVEGLELLLEQGLAQFEIWTKTKAPRKEIIEAFVKSNDGELAVNPPNFVKEESLFCN
jgi:shikimate 5-dehydrogenase